MRVMMLLKANAETEAGVLPSAELLTNMGNLIEEMVQAGVFLAGDGLKPSSAGKRVSYSGGARTVTDGPFAETKELIAGFSILNVASMDEALYWADRFAAVQGDCVSDIRPLFEPTDFPAEIFSSEQVARELELREELQSRGSNG
jgi:hypothetical protein